nr:hypothetical protein GCM10025732_21600 [Glycomyces mayteni]
MSVKHSLLALLERGPAYGYQLRSAFESATGNTWPLNIGQVYTTLNRLERDELVEALPENDSGQRPYRITDSGRRHLAGWFASPVQAADRPRDELTIKLALAVTTPEWTSPTSSSGSGRPPSGSFRSTPGSRPPRTSPSWRGGWSWSR